MTDIVERLKALVILDEVGSDNPLGRDAAAEIERLRALLYVETVENAALVARLAEAVEVVRDVTPALIAAISLLERGGKKAAASDKMFAQMLADYSASVERARDLLAKLEGQS